MWDSAAQQRAARYAMPEADAEAIEKGQTAAGFPVPPRDLPHYHGIGIGNETSSKEVTGA
jgi:hypothetical protein